MGKGRDAYKYGKNHLIGSGSDGLGKSATSCQDTYDRLSNSIFDIRHSLFLDIRHSIFFFYGKTRRLLRLTLMRTAPAKPRARKNSLLKK
jgi:hypothetical protein